MIHPLKTGILIILPSGKLTYSYRTWPREIYENSDFPWLFGFLPEGHHHFPFFSLPYDFPVVFPVIFHQQTTKDIPMVSP